MRSAGYHVLRNRGGTVTSLEWRELFFSEDLEEAKAHYDELGKYDKAMSTIFHVDETGKHTKVEHE